MCMHVYIFVYMCMHVYLCIQACYVAVHAGWQRMQAWLYTQVHPAQALGCQWATTIPLTRTFYLVLNSTPEFVAHRQPMAAWLHYGCRWMHGYRNSNKNLLEKLDESARFSTRPLNSFSPLGDQFS
jgi:hypothetical protein